MKGGEELLMAIVTFDDDQLLSILEWLENQRDAGYNIDEVIQGIKDGSLTTRVTVTDYRYNKAV